MSVSSPAVLPDVCEWSGGPPGCPGVVGRPSWIAGSSQEVLPDVQEWSGVLLDVQEWSGGNHGWSGGPSGCPVVVGRPHGWS